MMREHVLHGIKGLGSRVPVRAFAAGIALALLFYDLRLRGEGLQVSPDRPVETGRGYVSSMPLPRA